MSDALLTRIAEGIDALRADLKKLGGTTAAAVTKPAAGAAATPPKPAAAANKPDKAPAAAPAKPTPAATPAPGKKTDGPPGTTKGPGGKHTLEQVREAIRKVAANASLGKPAAKDILNDDGGGVERVADVKPENYDKVFEACTVLLSSEGAPATPAAEEDDLM